MISNVIEHPNFINSADLDFINDSVLSDRFPWYWAERQTTPGFPFLGHTLLSRDDDIHTSDSDVFDFFRGLLDSFCERHEFKINELLRGSLNLTYSFDAIHGDPHVDYRFDYSQCIMYLNTCDAGETIIFDEEYGENEYMEDIYEVGSDKKFTEILRIKPEAGKIIHFSGKNYHTHRWCRQGQRRVICVFAFI